MRTQDDIRSAKEELAITIREMKNVMDMLASEGDIAFLLAVAVASRATLEWVLEEGSVSQRFDELIQRLKHNTEMARKAASGFTGDVN